MKAFHSSWSRPFDLRFPNTPYFVEDFELLTTILSALKWQELNGTIAMFTDKIVSDYYHSIGLQDLWDDGIDNCLDDIPHTVNPSIFWAASKLYALRKIDCPCVMMDTDFIVWKPVSNLLNNSELSVIHREDINEQVYPNKFAFKTSFDLEQNLNWEISPCNTAFTYFGNEDFKKYYLSLCTSFMENSPLADNSLTYMVFAEQRMISMCADNFGIKIGELSSLPLLFDDSQKVFTHTWGYKQQMRENPYEREDFCTRCAKRIINDFPHMKDIIHHIESFHKYI